MYNSYACIPYLWIPHCSFFFLALHLNILFLFNIAKAVSQCSTQFIYQHYTDSVVLFSLCNNSYLLLPIQVLSQHIHLIVLATEQRRKMERWNKTKISFNQIKCNTFDRNGVISVYTKGNLTTTTKSLSTFQHFLKCSFTHYAARIKTFKEIMKPGSIIVLWLRFTLLQLCSACFSGNMLFSPPTQLSPIENLFL